MLSSSVTEPLSVERELEPLGLNQGCGIKGFVLTSVKPFVSQKWSFPAALG